MFSFSGNEIGNRYGKLVVIKKGESKGNKSVRAYWICQCDCGKTKSVRGENLRNGKTKSCGCLQLDSNTRRRMPNLEGAKRKAIRFLKGNAKSRSIPWGLSDEETFTLMESNCYYCGSSPSNISTSTSGDYFYSGIDRVNNDLGYIQGNVVPCCGDCNWAKKDFPLEKFLEWVKRVFNHTSKLHIS